MNITLDLSIMDTAVADDHISTTSFTSASTTSANTAPASIGRTTVGTAQSPTPATATSTTSADTVPPVAFSPSEVNEAHRTPRLLGYIRVSTREQNEARQVDALQAFGINQIFMDKQSGKDFARPAYIELLNQLRAGDVLVVKSIDRLERNYAEILEQWLVITKEHHAAIVVLDMPLLDTRNHRDLTGTLIADIVLQLLSYVAETERNFIKARQAEGIAAAKARGQRFGRPDKDRPENYPDVLALYRKELISINEGARRLGVCFHTFRKWIRQDEAASLSNSFSEA